MIQYETTLRWLIITHPLWLGNPRNALWKRLGEGRGSVAKLLLEWLKCGMMSRKEMLDGRDWKQAPKTECEALMLTRERSFQPATWGCSFQGTSWEFSETQQDIPHGSWVHSSLIPTVPGCTLLWRRILFCFLQKEQWSFHYGMPRLGTW